VKILPYLGAILFAGGLAFAASLNNSIDFPIQYNPGIILWDYNWTAQSSTDLVHWVDEPYERTNDTLIVHANGRPVLFLRVKGTP
jgi:hypothetical protein